MTKHHAESGTVRGRDGKVTWTLTADEAEVIADFIEESTNSRDAARADAAALRKAVVDARGCHHPHPVWNPEDPTYGYCPDCPEILRRPKTTAAAIR